MNEPKVINLDLRHSLWTAEREAFPDGVVEAILLAWSGNGDLEIRTSPKKESRYGTVLIRHKRADVSFSYEWDEPYDLVDAIEVDDLTEEESRYAARRIEEFIQNAEFGVNDSVQADSLDELLVQIDHLETMLIELESDTNEDFEAFCKEVASQLKERREKKK